MLSGAAEASLMTMNFQHCFQTLKIVTPFGFMGT